MKIKTDRKEKIMTYPGYRYSQTLTDEIAARALTPEANALAAHLVPVFQDRTVGFTLDGRFVGSGSQTSDGFAVSGRRGSEMWSFRVHLANLPRFIAAAHLAGALGEEPQR